MSLLTLLAPTSSQLQIPTTWQNGDVRLCVEVAFQSNPLDDTLLWEDITDYVREIAITRGRSGELDRFQPSTATITVESTGREFDPEYSLGPWYGYVLPNRAIRIRMQYANVDYFVWQGFVDEWPQDYAGMTSATIQVPCSDAFAWLSVAYTHDSPYEAVLQRSFSEDVAPTSWYRLDDAVGATTVVDQIGGITAAVYDTWTFQAESPLPSEPNAATTAAGTLCQIQLPPNVVTGLPWAIEWVTDSSSSGLFAFSTADYTNSNMVYATWQTYFSGQFWWIRQWYVPGGNVGGNKWANETVWSDRTAGIHHFCVGQNTDGSMFFYLDGVLRDASSNVGGQVGPPVAFLPTPTKWAIHREDTGTVDEIVVWDGAKPDPEWIAARSAVAHGWYGQTTAERADTLLDVMGWPDDLRSIGTGATTVGTDQTWSNNALDYLMTLVETEGGQCYVDGQGRIVFRGRTEMANDTRSAVSQAAFGDV